MALDFHGIFPIYLGWNVWYWIKKHNFGFIGQLGWVIFEMIT